MFKLDYKAAQQSSSTKQLIFKFSFSLFWLLFSLNTFAQLNPRDTIVDEGRCVITNEFLQTEQYKDAVSSRSSSGILSFNTDSEIPIVSASDFINYVNLDAEYSFSPDSRNNFNGNTIERYKQRYNGVEIENGGFAYVTGGGNPCNAQAMPYIQTNINTSTQNEIEFSELSNMINGEVESAEIVLSPVAQNDCNLKLVWRAIYTSPDGYHICWIDAESGATLKIRDANDSAFNTQNSSLSASIIKEITTNENNISTPGPINIYEVSALTTESAGCNGLTNEELMSGSLVCPPGSGTHQQAALYTNITTVLGCLGSSSAPLGPIVYDTINIGHGCGSCSGSGSAVALLGSNTTVANFGVPSCQGARSLETLAHELGHAYLNEFFPSSLSNTHQGLHEFFADMFAMYAASLGCGDLDWTMGDEDSDANDGDYDNQDLVRNFNLGQEEGCFFSYSLDDDTFQAHDYANPLRKLSFLLATSVEGNGAPLFTFNEVMVMVMDALSVFPSDGSIFDFVNHILIRSIMILVIVLLNLYY